MYNSSDIADKIKIMAKAKNVSVRKLLEDVGLGFNTMSNMKTSMPKVDNLAKIADYLDISIDYLVGRTDELNLTEISKTDDTNDIKSSTSELNENETELLRIYRSLSLRNKHELMSTAFKLEDAKHS